MEPSVPQRLTLPSAQAWVGVPRWAGPPEPGAFGAARRPRKSRAALDRHLRALAQLQAVPFSHTIPLHRQAALIQAAVMGVSTYVVAKVVRKRRVRTMATSATEAVATATTRGAQGP